jgi:hypothetical protein
VEGQRRCSRCDALDCHTPEFTLYSIACEGDSPGHHLQTSIALLCLLLPSFASSLSYHFPPSIPTLSSHYPTALCRLPADFGLPPTLGPKAFHASPLPDDVFTPDPLVALPLAPRDGASDGVSEEDSSDSRCDVVSSEISDVSI